jgi:hypothetical protein
MLVQLSRSDSHRKSTPTAIDLPLAADPPLEDFTHEHPSPVIALFGHPSRVAGLDAHLPAGWSIRRPQDLDGVHVDDIVLLTRAAVRDVTTARAVLPRRARIVAVVDDDAPAELVAGVLTAGADVCVRGGQPAILASHLVACRRRQLTDRWAAFEAALPRA